MLGFILGSLFGGTIGVCAMSLCVVAKEADRELECRKSEEDF